MAIEREIVSLEVLLTNFKEGSDMHSPGAEKIARLNDEFRKSGHGIKVTPGVQALEDMVGLIDEIRKSNDFTEDNDPYGEHDFGTVYWYGEKVFWKIDYYDPTLRFGSDPLDETCNRVLTIMLACEY